MSATFTASASFPRLGLVTCNAADPDVFGPAGHHLRWFVPGSVGFPAAGFDIRRIDRSPWESGRDGIADTADVEGTTGWTSSLNWTERDRHHPVHEAAVIVTGADASLKPTPSGLRFAAVDAGRHILIHFREPVIYVRLVTRPRRAGRRRGGPARADSNSIQVRHGAALIDTVAMADEIQFERPGITDLLVPNTLDSIVSLTFVRELAAAEYAKRVGQLLTHIDLPRNASDAYKLVAVDTTMNNRFFAGDQLDDLKKQYPPAKVADLVAHLESTVDNPRRLVHTPEGPEFASAPVRVLDHIRLATVDPNVARMLASYWVDLKPKAGLYVVQGDHDDDAKTLSFGFAFSRDGARVPRLPKSAARQLPGIEFRGSTPLGRAGLMWQTGRRDLRDTSGAVMMDIERRTDGKIEPLTQERPHLISTATELKFTDSGLPVPGSYSWAVTPIDIFGRSGKQAETSKLAMVDLERPVPPRHVVAGLEQYGAPWTDPGERDAARDRTGAVHATAEFAEAQSRVAPDAAELRWCWRSGAAGASNREPSAWQVLHTSPIEPPKPATFTWKDTIRLTRYPLTVAEGRIEDQAARAASLERLDAITREAVDAIPATPKMVEVLLNVALLEPDLFVGHRIEIGDELVSVIGSTAGVAADDDRTPDRRLTARLFLPFTDATIEIDRGDVLHVSHPLGPDWAPGRVDPDGAEIPPPLIHLPLPDGERSDGRAEGGEVAVDLRFSLPTTADGPVPADHDDPGGGERTTIVGRVVADHEWPVESTGRRTQTARSVLGRVRPADADRLLQVERLMKEVTAVARHHRPYVMPRTSLGLDGAPGDIELDLGPADRFATLWITAYVVDAGGKDSAQVATPAELRPVRPPPDEIPAAPYPEREGASSDGGQLSPPDVDGESTVAVAWPPSDVGAMADHVRYELGRALGSTVVAADRDRWMRGKPLDDALALGVVAGPSVGLTVRSDFAVHPNGTASVVVDPPSDALLATLQSISSGRVRIGPPSTGRHHRLAKIATIVGGADDGAVQILFRPYVEATASSMGGDPTGKTCTVEGAPDYRAVLADDDLLRQLANVPGTGSDDSNERAFGLVTGVPVAGTRFVDRLAGRGRSRYFYKVRAVFPGETRSAWSPCSVAFHQVDATSADPPIDVVLGTDGRLATFRLPDDPLVVGVRVTTRVDGLVVDERNLLVDSTDVATILRPARVAARRGLLDLSAALGTAVFTDPADPPPVLGVYPADVSRSNPPVNANLLQADSTGAFAIARSVAVPREYDGLPLAIRLAGSGPGGGDRWVDTIPGRHEVELDPDGPVGDAVASNASVRHTMRTSKTVVIRGTEVAFDSPDVRIGQEVADVVGG